jgi:hypothetical protein
MKRPIAHSSKSPPTAEETIAIVLSLPVSFLILEKPEVALLTEVVDEIDEFVNITVDLSGSKVQSVGFLDVQGRFDGFVFSPGTKNVKDKFVESHFHSNNRNNITYTQRYIGLALQIN